MAWGRGCWAKRGECERVRGVFNCQLVRIVRLSVCQFVRLSLPEGRRLGKILGSPCNRSTLISVIGRHLSEDTPDLAHMPYTSPLLTAEFLGVLITHPSPDSHHFRQSPGRMP